MHNLQTRDYLFAADSIIIIIIIKKVKIIVTLYIILYMIIVWVYLHSLITQRVPENM